MPAFLAASTCGTRTRGSVPARRSIRSTFWLFAWSMPCTHCETWPWFCHSMKRKPTSLATLLIAVSMFLVKGLADDTGMLKIVLPAMHFLASKAGPGATNCGFLVKGSSCFLKESRSAACACATKALQASISPTSMRRRAIVPIFHPPVSHDLEPAPGDFLARGEPHVGEALGVFDEAAKGVHPPRASDDPGMKTDRHHPRESRGFGI